MLAESGPDRAPGNVPPCLLAAPTGSARTGARGSPRTAPDCSGRRGSRRCSSGAPGAASGAGLRGRWIGTWSRPGTRSCSAAPLRTELMMASGQPGRTFSYPALQLNPRPPLFNARWRSAGRRPIPCLPRQVARESASPDGGTPGEARKAGDDPTADAESPVARCPPGPTPDKTSIPFGGGYVHLSQVRTLG
jgi:hypothetical protein